MNEIVALDRAVDLGDLLVDTQASHLEKERTNAAIRAERIRNYRARARAKLPIFNDRLGIPNDLKHQ